MWPPGLHKQHVRYAHPVDSTAKYVLHICSLICSYMLALYAYFPLAWWIAPSRSPLFRTRDPDGLACQPCHPCQACLTRGIRPVDCSTASHDGTDSLMALVRSLPNPHHTDSTVEHRTHPARKKVVHRFLCPQKAIGRPDKMSTAPRMPKAGSIFVCSGRVCGGAFWSGEALAVGGVVEAAVAASVLFGVGAEVVDG